MPEGFDVLLPSGRKIPDTDTRISTHSPIVPCIGHAVFHKRHPFFKGMGQEAETTLPFNGINYLLRREVIVIYLGSDMKRQIVMVPGANLGAHQDKDTLMIAFVLNMEWGEV